ncbi:tetratricopeptide repeat protein [Amycolatopsis sp. Hca4]|uniref:tetratricopeptide repeat protein n=1 Tax=Amycolatopsis sp. Hca4 TaxID=2742131 RepID=UPI0034CE8EFC
MACYRQALRLVRGTRTGYVESNLSWLCLRLGRPDDAVRHAERELRLRRTAGDAVGEAYATQNLAAALHERVTTARGHGPASGRSSSSGPRRASSVTWPPRSRRPRKRSSASTPGKPLQPTCARPSRSSSPPTTRGPTFCGGVRANCGRRRAVSRSRRRSAGRALRVR